MLLNINNEYWHLYFVDKYDPILCIGDDNYTLGVTIPKWHRIYINNQLSGEQLMSVISHEVAHAEFASRGLYMPTYIEEVLSDIISDNIIDSYYQMNNVCRYYGKC